MNRKTPLASPIGAAKNHRSSPTRKARGGRPSRTAALQLRDRILEVATNLFLTEGHGSTSKRRLAGLILRAALTPQAIAPHRLITAESALPQSGSGGLRRGLGSAGDSVDRLSARPRAARSAADHRASKLCSCPVTAHGRRRAAASHHGSGRTSRYLGSRIEGPRWVYTDWLD